MTCNQPPRYHILVGVGRCAGLIVEAFISETDEMVGINALDVGGDRLSPGGDGRGGT